MGEALSWEELAERHRADATDDQPDAIDESVEPAADRPDEEPAGEEPPAEPRAPADD
jgi:hypothetical protein